MRAKRATVPVVELSLDLSEARELLFILGFHRDELMTGRLGEGKAIRDRCEFVDEVRAKLEPLTLSMLEELSGHSQHREEMPDGGKPS